MKHQSVVKGTSYLLIAQAVFIFSGYIVHLGLGRSLGPVEYGIYSVIISVATVFNIILATGLPQAASKYISENETASESILKVSFCFSALISLIFSAVIFIGSNNIALLLNDPLLAPYIKIISLMILPYALLTVIQGYYNGIRDYKTQSILILIYNFLKPVLIFFFVFMGFSVRGAVLGFAVSPIIPLILGIYILNISKIIKFERFPLVKILKFAVPVIMFSLAINLITTLDLFFVKRILISNELVGYYSAASTISKVPYSLMGAVTVALFPAVSATMHNPVKMQEYIRESLRYTLLFILPVTAIVAASSAPLISLLYSELYWPAGQPLGVLIVGISLFSIFAVLTTVMNAAGMPKVAMLLSIFILAVDCLLNTFMVPVWGMIGAAGATTISCAVGMAIAALYVHKRFGVLTSGSSAMKILFASAILYALLFNANLTGAYLLLGYGTLGIIYLTLLYAMGEIKEKDITRFKSLIPVRTIK